MRFIRARALIVLLLVATGLHHAVADTAFLDRPPETAFRLMSYNPYWNAIFSRGTRRYDRSDEFRRVLAAVDPDIVCLQEIDPGRERDEILSIFNSALPLPPGEQWQIASGADNVIVSRFPILRSRGEMIQGSGTRERGHVITLISIPGPGAATVVIAGTHFTSGGSPDQVQARTDHADALVAHIREFVDARGDGTELPVVVAGDLNAYTTDSRRHLDTLILGDIANEGAWGPNGSLDPAGIPAVDLLPQHNANGSETWSWRDDTQDFPSYALDRIIYSDSVLETVHSYVLNTSVMSREDLQIRDLQAGDIALNLRRGIFDHLPLVADFVFR